MNRTVNTFSATELTLWSWFVFGAVVVALIPQARGVTTIGWLPFWLVVAPLIDLGLFHRTRLLSTSRTLLVRSARRRRPPLQQTRRPPRRRAVVSLGARTPRMA